MAKEIAIPWELKYKFAMGGWTSLHKGWFYAVREEYGADKTLKIYEKVLKMDGRIQNLTNTVLNVFKLEGNDAETIGQWFDIWWKLIGSEYTILERSEIIDRRQSPQCLFQTEPQNISDWVLLFTRLVAKTINPKATCKRPKGRCAGDPYCEYVFKIEE